MRGEYRYNQIPVDYRNSQRVKENQDIDSISETVRKVKYEY